MKFQSSAEAAAAFASSRQRRQLRRHDQTQERELPLLDDQSIHQLAADIQRVGVQEPEPIPLPPAADQRRSVPIRISAKLHAALQRHCREFEITPHEFIRRALEAAKLSRGGV